jgi:2-polyprenyl-3-methyl-5-hydroxy-6-metoxy-1,4-benzoquinol methylase
MDVATEATPELERDLGNLASLNRRFGAVGIVTKRIAPLLRRREPLRILDLATGGGDIPRAIVRQARALQCPVAITAVDRQAATLQIAEKASADFPEISFVPGDIVSLEPVADHDVVMCNLALHHFEESDVIRILRRCGQWATQAVLITDLRRSRLAQVAIVAVTELFYREPMTRHDARVSAARAFSFGELHRLAVAAGWWGFEHRRSPFFRQLLWLEPGQRRR